MGRDCGEGDKGSEIRKEIMVALNAIGINSERAHHEVGTGQHEIGFRYDNALITADLILRQSHLKPCTMSVT